GHHSNVLQEAHGIPIAGYKACDLPYQSPPNIHFPRGITDTFYLCRIRRRDRCLPAIFLACTFVQGAGVPYEDEVVSKQGVSSFVNQGSDERNPPENSAVDSAISVVHEENSNRQPNVDDAVPPPACTCTYTGRNYKVIAYYGTDIFRIRARSEKKNEKVKFQCHDFGIYRLIGKKEITCEDCRPWHSAEYPNCVTPARAGVPYEDEEDSKQGASSFVNQGSDNRNPPENKAVDSAISVVHEENSKRQPNVDDAVPPPAYGNNEITCEEDCRAWLSDEYPSCELPETRDAILQFPNDSKYLPGNTVVIQKGAGMRITCRLIGLNEFPKWALPNPQIVRMTDIWLTNGYPGSELHISNIREQHNGRYECYGDPNRKKVFHIQVQNLNGGTTTCFVLAECVEGEKNAFQCMQITLFHIYAIERYLRCPRLNVSKGMHISYTSYLYEGSIAAFHCLLPMMRTGVSSTTCEEGEWVDPVPTCTLPSCSLDSLFRIVPENVVPVMDNRGMANSRVQCVAGCPNPLKTKDSELLVEPDKDFYRFGESVTLACSPGYVLSSEVVRLMCLGSTCDSQKPQCFEDQGPLRDVKEECMPINKENTFNEIEESLNKENEEKLFSNENKELVPNENEDKLSNEKDE
ncbi:protein lev-9, partial [Caerostris extrusa]